ncbi:MAG: class I SAM-dependent methyltransferase [Anaerolineae bacterium]|nr:class I SAM-dependent methyltransferase [Thermoflexales bacterium]MDW8407482.1 class I SAM-dependent methyltransferase [Anaerolineae bacterium]
MSSSPLDKATAVQYAYRLILGREPSAAEVLAHLGHPDLQALRRSFFESQEFRSNYRWLCGATLSGYEPPLSVQDWVDPATLKRLFVHIQASWRTIGEQEPYWSVLSADEYKLANIQGRLEEFYRSGWESFHLLVNTMKRNGLDDRLEDKTLLEYGCGVGRVTNVLAQKFKRVHAYDVSTSHLALARQVTDSLGLANVHYVAVQSLRDMQELPQVDMAYSIIVLQHNPPPIIRLILESMLDALKPGGTALFQLLTYQEGYSFRVEEYLSSPRPAQIEMHVLPQQRVFEIIADKRCRVLEVLDDALAGYRKGQLSNTFLVQKR